MENNSLKEIERIDKQLQSDPNNSVLWFQLLSRFIEDENLHGHPKRVESILRFIHNNPRDGFCRTPYVQIDPKKSKEGYEKVKKIWDMLLRENAGDAVIAQGAANCYCCENIDLSKQVLQSLLDDDPMQAELWLDLGRYSTDANERLTYFKLARKYGSDQPNLPVWILTTALELYDYETVDVMVNELLAFMKSARKEYGEKLDCLDKPDDRWDEALQATGDRKSASTLVRAITMYAEYKHYVHTALGHIALRKNDVESAIKHLSESGHVVSTPRLSSYGPSFSLAKKLCEQKKWEAVEEYLERCSQFWDNDKLPNWISMVKVHKVPDFESQD